MVIVVSRGLSGLRREAINAPSPLRSRCTESGEGTSHRQLKQQKHNIAQVLTKSSYTLSELLVLLISLWQFSDTKHLWCLLSAEEHLESIVGTECVCQSTPVLLFLGRICVEMPVRSNPIKYEFSNSAWATWATVVQQTTAV